MRQSTMSWIPVPVLYSQPSKKATRRKSRGVDSDRALIHVHFEICNIYIFFQHIFMNKKLLEWLISPAPPLWNSDRNSFENEAFSTKTSNLKSVEPCERILRALFISQCSYKFSSSFDLKNAFNRFRLFSRDFRLFRFFFPGSSCFSTLASARNLSSWVKYYGKFESFWKEFQMERLKDTQNRNTVIIIFSRIFILLFPNQKRLGPFPKKTHTPSENDTGPSASSHMDTSHSCWKLNRSDSELMRLGSALPSRVFLS